MTKNNRNMTNSKAPWMGYIPSEWELYPTKRLFSISSGSTPESKNPDYWGEDISWITPADFKTSTKYVSIGAKSITKDGYESCSTELIPENSIVMSKRAPIGEVSLTLCPLCTNQGCLTCVPNDYADSNYYYYVLATASEHLKSLGNGTTFQELSATKFKEMKVVKPILPEQQQIAAYLDDKCAKIDEAITKHRTLIEKLKEYRKAVITKAVTKGLDPNVEMKDSGVGSIGLISKSANVIRMKFLSLCPITDGTHQTPEYDDKENGCPFLSSKDITSGKIDWNNIKYITKQLHEILYKTVSPHKGDILLAKNGTTGIAALVEDEKVFDIYVTLALIRPDTTKVISKYLLYAINCSATKEQFNKHLLGIGVPNLHLNVIDNTYIVIHDISIQEKIVSFLDTKCAKIDEAIARHEGLITKLEEYKKSIIYNAVTGKIDCRKDAE